LVRLHNDPWQPDRYVEFRRRVLHLSSLDMAHELIVRPITYEEVLPISLPLDRDAPELLDALDKVLDALNKGYSWVTLREGGPPVLTRVLEGKRIATNYYPSKLGYEERRDLYLEAEALPDSAILVDMRPGHPGGEYPFRGYILFRSFDDTLGFIAQGISAAPEFDVEKDPRTGPVPANPTFALKINETKGEPTNATFKIQHGGFWYSIETVGRKRGEAPSWNQEAFRTVHQLYEMTVVKDLADRPSPAITIAK